MKPQTDFQFSNGMTAAQLRDVSRHLIAVMGAEAYNAWAPAVADHFHEAAEAKLLEIHGRQTRAEDREHFEQLCQERRAAQQEQEIASYLAGRLLDECARQHAELRWSRRTA